MSNIISATLLLYSSTSAKSFMISPQVFLKVIDTIAYYKYNIFSSLLERAIEEGWINENLISFFECIDILPSEDKYKAFDWLLELAIMKGWIEDHFLSFLETIKKLQIMDRYNTVRLYLANMIKNQRTLILHLFSSVYNLLSLHALTYLS